MGQLFNQVTNSGNLSAAWDEVVDAKSKPGIDGETIELFVRRWEENIIELRKAVRGNWYKPAPLVRFTIPKKDGTPRLLGKLTIRDKLLQRAALQILGSIYEQTFLDCSYAYRPGRSVHQVVDRLVEARVMGRWVVLNADIRDFFHSLNHALLLRFVRETIRDAPLLALIESWLKVGRPNPQAARGTPLGAVISPLLSNIYLHYLDLAMTHKLLPLPGNNAALQPPPDWVYLRYADDFVVLCRTVDQAELALQVVTDVLHTLQLALKPGKTAITTFQEGFTYLGCHFQGDHFYFEHKQERIKVADDHGWNLFYDTGPDGYGNW